METIEATGIDDEAILEFLNTADVSIRGQLVKGSNYTFLVDLEKGSERLQAIYKPVKGEIPLWDFPARSLAKREVAAWVLDNALGWQLVPPTIFRRGKLPLGAGSLQLFIPHDPNDHYFLYSQEDRRRLGPVVLFDLILNNADRKGSHLVRDVHDHIWCIDHGVCFHEEFKLRTVIWDFMGQSMPADLLKDVKRCLSLLEPDCPLFTQVKPFLKLSEIKALQHRVQAILNQPEFPVPDDKRKFFPYPPI